MRWEIETADQPCKQDSWSREIVLTARPTYRNVRIKWNELSTAEKAFIHGDGNLNAVRNTDRQKYLTDDIVIPDVGPRIWRYSLSDRDKMPRFWMTKIHAFVSSFAAEVVGTAGQYRQLVIQNPILRGNYAKMVETETLRVISGMSHPQPTITDTFMEVDVTQHSEGGMPELVAAKLVEDVFDADHFQDFVSIIELQ